jgi:hypothetical protein
MKGWMLNLKGWSEMSSLFKLFNLGVAGAALCLLFIGGVVDGRRTLPGGGIDARFCGIDYFRVAPIKFIYYQSAIISHGKQNL